MLLSMYYFIINIILDHRDGILKFNVSRSALRFQQHIFPRTIQLIKLAIERIDLSTVTIQTHVLHEIPLPLHEMHHLIRKTQYDKYAVSIIV